MYQKDVTQALTPSDAGPGTAINAITQKGKVTEAAIGALGEGFQAKVDWDIKQSEADATALRNDFFEKNMAQEAYARTAVARDTVAKNVLADTIFMGPKTEADSKISEENEVVLSSLTSDAQRLSEAAQGGMSNEQYVTRVNTLTKRSIAQYPGLADQIRKRIGGVTGMPFADEWASRQFVATRFTADTKKEGGSSEDKAATKDIDDMASLGFDSRENLTKLREVEPVKYAEKVFLLRQHKTAESQLKLVTNNLAQETAVGDVDARRQQAAFVSMMDAGVSVDFLRNQIVGKDNNFENTLNAIGKAGGVTDAADLSVQVDIHAANVRRLVDKNADMAKSALREYWKNNPAISKATRDEMMANIASRSDELKSNYSSKEGLVLMATIMKTYKNEKLEQQFKLISLATQQQAAWANNPLVAQYWQGGEAREGIKRQYPALYNFISEQEKTITGSGDAIKGLLGQGAGSAAIGAALVQSTENKSPTPPATTPALSKAGQEIVASSATAVLDNFKKTGVVTTEATNQVGTWLVNSIKDGSDARNIAEKFSKHRDVIPKLPEPELNEIKAAVEQQSTETVGKLTQSLREFNKIHGTKLMFGQASSGNLSLVAPPGALTSYADNLKYRETADMFKKTYGPQMANLVNVNSLVKGVPINDVAKEYSLLLNGSSAASRVGTERGRGTTTGVALDVPTNISTPTTSIDANKIVSEQTPAARTASNIQALEDELKRLEKRPSWISEGTHSEQVKLIKQELDNERAKGSK